MKRMRADAADASLALAWAVFGDFEQRGSRTISYVPANGTYRGVDRTRTYITTVQDSGRARVLRDAMSELSPFIAAALYETAFCWEAGPLSSWRN